MLFSESLQAQVFISTNQRGISSCVINSAENYEVAPEIIYEQPRNYGMATKISPLKLTDSTFFNLEYASSVYAYALEYNVITRKNKVIGKFKNELSPVGLNLLKDNNKIYWISYSDTNTVIVEYNLMNSTIETYDSPISVCGFPKSGLMKATNGLFYFLSTAGVVSFSNQTFDMEIAYNEQFLTANFVENGALIEAIPNRLYGTRSSDVGHHIFYYDYLADTLVFESSIPSWSSDYPIGLYKSVYDGNLYGTIQGSSNVDNYLYKYEIATNTVTPLSGTYDANITNGVTEVNSKLYGVGSNSWPSNNIGFVYSYDIPNDTFEIIKYFEYEDSIGKFPIGGLIAFGDTLLLGNIKDCENTIQGGLFSYNLNNQEVISEYVYFADTTLYMNVSELVLANNFLFGVQQSKPNYDDFQRTRSRLVRLNPETEEFEILAEMDGSFIVTPLSFDQDSLLYFTLGQVTTTGEQNNNVCTYNTFTNAITIVYSAPNVISPQLINVFGYPNNRFVLISKTIEVPTITKLSVIDVSSQSETLLFELSNNYNLNVKLFGNKLISVTDNAIFEIDIATNQLDTLYLLSSPGEFPQFPKFCISPDSIIYGIAFLGPYLPTLYSFDLKINQFNILTDYNIGGYEYLSQSNLIFGSDYKIHGIGNGAESVDFRSILFSYDLQNDYFDYKLLPLNGDDNIAYLTEIPFEPSFLQNESNHVYSIYPNPTTNEVNVYTQNEIPLSIEVIDFIGNPVMNFSGFQYPFATIQLTNVPSGVYQIKIIFQDQTFVISTLVVV